MSKPDARDALELEKWLQGELSDEQRSQLQERVGHEELERFRLEDAALKADLMGSLPPAALAERVQARAADSSSSLVRIAGLMAPLAAAALFLSVWQWRSPPIEQPLAENKGASSTERAKGLTPQIRVYRKRVAESVRLQQGEQARAGDLLQVGYVAAGRRHGVLLSLDGRGAVTLHVPENEASSTELSPDSGEHLLGSAYELDAAPEFERFVLVLSSDPIPVALVVQSAERLGQDPRRARADPLNLPAGLEQVSLLLRKVQP